MKNTFTDLLIRKQTVFTRNQIKALIMRMSQVYLLIMVPAMMTMAAPKGNGQSIESTFIQLEIVDKPLRDAFREIEKQTKFLFKWDTDVEKRFPKVSLPQGKYTVKDAIEQLLRSTSLKFQQHKNHIMIVPIEGDRTDIKKKDENESDLPDQSSKLVVTGKVRDASTQEPLAGVNIIVKGTTKGATTDVEGKFSIEAEENDVLVFSFIGFQPIEISIGGRSVIDVAMNVDVTALKEVIVNAGYWDVKQREKTGNIAKVSGIDIQKSPVSNPLATLQGRVPGLEITQLTGVPGGNFTVRIRGQQSIANGNDPLYIIDGVPYISTSMAFNQTSGELFVNGTSPLNSINPSDIESVEVLKDADATAIYGSRGSNGVILITTKREKFGENKIDFNVYTGMSKVAHTVNLLSTEQYVLMRKEAYKNDGMIPSGFNARDLLQWDTTRYTDWQKELFGGTAYMTDAQLKFSGGNSSTQFVIGGGYHKETTVFPGNAADQRGSVHFNLNNISPNKRFKTTISTNYSINDSDLLKQDLTRYGLQLPPNAPAIYSDDGELNWADATWTNPHSYLKRKYQSNISNLIGNLALAYDIIPGLEIKTSLGYTNVQTKNVTLTPNTSYNPLFAASIPHSSVFSNRTFQTWIVEPQINWRSKVGVGTISITAGSTFQDQRTEGTAQFASGFVSESLMQNIKAATTIVVDQNNYIQYRYNAVFGRINYNLKDKYFMNLTGRRDGSSRFGPGKQFANFGALGAAWIFSNENFFQNSIPVVSFGKIRFSYGITGNDQLGDYQFLDTYTTSGPYQGSNGLSPVRLYNPDFSWETNKKFEAALELGFVNDRILFNGTYYRNRSSSQLVGYSLPPTAGFPSIQMNLPATVQNTGVELELSTTNVRNSWLTWTSSLNWTIPRDKLIEYPNIAGSTYANRYVVGESLNIRKLLNHLGVDQQSGVYQFEDINNDGVFSTPDFQTVKKVGRDFYGGLLNSLQVKGFQLDMLFQFVEQTGYDPMLTNWGYPGSVNNQHVSVMDRWKVEGDLSQTEKFTSSFTPAAIAYSNLGNSSKIVFDASFIRLKNLAVSYMFDRDLTEKLKMKNLRIYIQAQNLFTITKYEGLDPESQQIVLPPLRTITCGLNASF